MNEDFVPIPPERAPVVWKPAEKRRSHGRRIGLVFTALLTALAAVLFSSLASLACLATFRDGIDRFFLREVFEGYAVPVVAGADEVPVEAELDDGLVAVRTADLSAGALWEIDNRTGFPLEDGDLTGDLPSLRTLAETDREYGKSQPDVLIVHTHATESYREAGVLRTSPDTDFHTDDEAASVVAVGDVLAEVLVAGGVNVFHCTVAFDRESGDPFDNSARQIEKLLSRYPGIQYVIDLHREEVGADEGFRAATATVDGVSYAQILLLCGTDGGGTAFPDWPKNLRFALALRDELGRTHPSLLRPVSLRSPSYNEELAPVFLHAVIGSCGNTLEEACRSAVRLGEALVKTVTGHPADGAAGQAVMARFQ